MSTNATMRKAKRLIFMTYEKVKVKAKLRIRGFCKTGLNDVQMGDKRTMGWRVSRLDVSKKHTS